MSSCEGHRARVKEKFARHGLDGFLPHEILELILFYAVPRVDTKPAAHRLMERFGSLSAVLEASEQDLAQVEGVGSSSALLIRLIAEVMRTYSEEKCRPKRLIAGTDAAGEYAAALLTGRVTEAFYVICLDVANRLNFAARLSEGSVQETYVNKRMAVETAIRYGAAKVILAHNHPAGTMYPSYQDIKLTEELIGAMHTVGIEVADHIITGNGGYFSFAANGMI